MTQFSLDKQQIRRSFAKASKSYDGMANLQRKVGRELIKQVSLPEQASVLDLGCGTGFFTQQLIEKVGLKNIVALDLAVPMLLQTRSRLVEYDISLVCADAEALPFVDESVDSVVSNLALQWCMGLDDLFVDVQRVLRPKGSFIFSSFGASALHELKEAWANVDNYRHVNEFCSVAEVSEKLQQAGFHEVQVVTKTYMSQYPDVLNLMRELKAIGAHNVSHQRNKQLTSKRQLQALISAYPKEVNGGVKASFEIIYAQAVT